jgi:tellurite resistance protein
VLLTFLRQHLREGAGQPIPTRYRKVAEVDQDLKVVLSLLARVSGTGGEAPGAAVVAAALERLRHLAPFEKPKVLKACLEAASSDGSISAGEGELVRMVAATLDCPVPPLLLQAA